MPTSRPFAYNTGSVISGTQQFGSLAVGTPTSGVTGSPQWWNGPDEELGYVIAESVSGNTQPTPVSGVSASVGFFRSTGLTESSYINLAQRISINQTFATGNDAYLWLSGNGYWSSWVYSPVTPVTGGTGTIISYTAGNYLDAYTQTSGVTSTDGISTNNGCWQLYYAHSAVTITTGSNKIGLNTYLNGSNSWTWYCSVSTTGNTIGSWGTVSAITSLQSFGYSTGGFNQSNITTNVTVPAGRYFLIANNGGPFYRTVKSLAANRTAQIGGSNYITICNKVCLGNWPTGGTTVVPTQFGGSGTGYSFYSAHTHVHSVKFG
jgi:hypothetical protein